MHWSRYPRVERSAEAKAWLELIARRGREPNTLDAYARSLSHFLVFLDGQIMPGRTLGVGDVGEEHIALWIADMRSESSPSEYRAGHPRRGNGLSNATMQLRLSAVRLFYDYLLRKKVVSEHPVPRGTFHASRNSRGTRGLLPRQTRMPWIPSAQEWTRLIASAQCESLRNRLMFCLAYEGAMRREELCRLEITDLDISHRLVRLRAETTKGKRDRTLSYSQTTGMLLRQYLVNLKDRARQQGKPPTAMFPSLSNRNRGQPIGVSTWTKVVEKLAERADLPQFTTHTFRHLRLTDLARAGWETHEIMAYAGHQQVDTTMIYIHLSGRDLQQRIARTTIALEESLRQITAQRQPAAGQVKLLANAALPLTDGNVLWPGEESG